MLPAPVHEMSESFLPQPPMKKPTVRCGWSEIPQELLDLIARNLINYADYVRVRAVCPSWRSSLPKKPHQFLTRLPWLLLPHFKSTTISETHCSVFSLADNKAYKLELPEVIGKGKRCWGSPHGWLIILHEDRPLFSLLNPLTRAQIQLPSSVSPPSALQNGYVPVPGDYVGDLCDFNVVKAVLFGNPSVSTDFVVMVIIEDGPCGLAFFGSGRETWTLITDTEKIIYHDVVCFEGQFYAVDKDGIVYICNLGASPNVVKVADPAENIEDDEPKEKYLVNSVKGLLLVYRFHMHIYDTYVDSTYYFTVHKLDLSESKWSEIEDLGGQVLFLGTNCSFSLSARDYPGCRENSIYYTDDKRYPVRYLGDSESKNGCIRGHDLGVFNIDDGDIQPLPGCPVPRPSIVKYMLPPPVWVTVSPET